ncbi:hypothetical protein R6Q59_027150 [Mikania micrantha]
MISGKLRFVIYVWFVYTCGSCLGSLKVSSPENLKGTYECVVSKFGVPEHGGTLTGVVEYPNVNQEACIGFTHEFTFKTKIHSGSLPVFLLVDGRDCYFTSKAWNAQNAGAAGILVTYDEISTSMHFPEEADSYNMKNLTIPLALISRSLGDSIKNALYDGEFVRVNLEWTEAFTHDQDDQLVDMNKNSIDDQNEWDVHLTSHFMWYFMIKSILF